MVIKSNRKKDYNFLGQVIKFLKKHMPSYNWISKALILMSFFIGAVFMWGYSGILAFGLILIGLSLTINTNIGVGDRIVFILLSLFAIGIIGTANIYERKPRIIPVEFSKIVYTDSTEKIVVFVTKPFKKTVVLHFDSATYYTIKEYDNNVTIQIIETGKYTHWQKLANRNDVVEYYYDFQILAGNEKFTKHNWKKEVKEQLFK